MKDTKQKINIIKIKRCKECLKVLKGSNNKSGLCNFHVRKRARMSLKRKRIKLHLCVDCGKNPKPLTYRCKKCNDTNARWIRKNKHNK